VSRDSNEISSVFIQVDDCQTFREPFSDVQKDDSYTGRLQHCNRVAVEQKSTATDLAKMPNSLPRSLY